MQLPLRALAIQVLISAQAGLTSIKKQYIYMIAMIGATEVSLLDDNQG